MVLSTFNILPAQSLLFCVGVEPTIHRFEDNCFTIKLALIYQDVLSLLLPILLDKKYNTSPVFRLANYSTVFLDSGLLLHQLYCHIALPCEVELYDY